MAEPDNDIILFASEDQKTVEEISPKDSWKLIVADDDAEVHAVTSLALSNLVFKGKPLHIISSYSSEETKKVISENPDTAVILLDVVMENHDSGLQLVKFIREKAKNRLVRIILRTGQPGYAPELEVITEYDINDYKEKTELTSSKLVTTLISSIRNFDDLKRIEESRQSLSVIASTTAKLHGLESQIPFRTKIFETMNEVLRSFSELDGTEVSIFDGIMNENSIIIQGGTGIYKDREGNMDLQGLISPVILEKMKIFALTETIFFDDNDCAILLLSRRGIRRLLYLKNIPELSEMKKDILWTFSLNISTVYSNIELLEEQQKTEKEIRKSLDEKLILVKEIHHRVKNNLQIISSLLHMQSSGIGDKKVLALLKESEDRVQSMSLVHEKLYQSDLMATIDFTEYISSLAERLVSSYSVSDTISLEVETVPLMLSINTAIPCGLIINEILTNSIKYAFPNLREGKIHITLKVEGEQIFLKISDNGVGLPDDFNMDKVKSLGMKLIHVLIDQIDGKISIIRNKGTTYELSFSESEERES
ncbi:MAG: DUF3369 domain-containing protein [Spirochaetaceae bacterium]|nr:DUF3369 domain-containing protein [Spirochaetaceae bacterium]